MSGRGKAAPSLDRTGTPETRRRLDDIIRAVFRGVADQGHFVYDPDLGINGTLAAMVRDECRTVGLRVSPRHILKRVADVGFGDVDVEPRGEGVTH